MKTVVLVGCGKAKLPYIARAEDLYTGALFRKARAYAEKFGDEWGILSAKHGLILPNQMIEPYDLCLDDLDRNHMAQWIRDTNEQIQQCWPREFFVCMAGELYGRAFLRPTKLSVEFPMAGLGLGERLRYLNQALLEKKYS